MLAKERLRKAAEWHVTLESEAVTERDIHTFRQWRSHPDNALAFEEIEKTWGAFEVSAGSSGRLLIQGLLDQSDSESERLGLRSLLPVLSLIVLLPLLAVVAAGYAPMARLLHSDFLLADFRAGLGEMSSSTLEDGSRLNLRSLTAVDVSYSDNHRLIDLSHGELQVQVAHDRQRPLTVVAGRVTATAEGTEYSVRYTDNRVDISVTESVVRVCHQAEETNDHSPCIRLHAGEAVSVDESGIHEVQSRYSRVSYDWESGHLMVPGQPVSQVLAELKRHYSGVILYDAEALEPYLVSGRFPLNDMRKTLDLLVQSAPLNVRYSGPFIVHVEREGS